MSSISQLSARLVDLFGNPLTANPAKLLGNLTVNPTGTIGIGTGIVMPDGYTIANTPMGRNKIINGACLMSQRPSIVCSTGVSGYGGPDRFYAANANSAGGQFTQSYGTITYGGIAKQAVVQTVNTAISSLTGTNFWYGITQKIEGLNCFDMLGQPAVISFIFSTNVTGTYSVCLTDGPTVANTFVSTFNATAGVPAKVIIPVASLPINLATPNNSNMGLSLSIGAINQGTYQTSTLNAWQAVNSICASGSTNWGASINNFIAVTELQIETGSNATPFERRHISLELALCQRYYAVSTHENIFSGNVSSGFSYYHSVSWPVYMRGNPTVVNTGVAFNGFASANPGATPANTGSINTLVANATVNGGYFGYTWTANAEI